MRIGGVFAVVLPFLAAACGSDFVPSTQVDGVRILATRADNPYARPGETVSLEVLATDGRADQTRPLNIYWVKTICENPQGDLYYACFDQLRAQPGVDLGPTLASGPKFSFDVPADALSAHPPSRSGPPYGFLVVFNIACAGHVEATVPDPSHPQAPPLACFDDNHVELGPDEWVFGFERVYVYDGLRNHNPQIDSVSWNGDAVDPAAGITLDHCTSSKVTDCPKTTLDVSVPQSSQETVGPIAPGGDPEGEQIWVDWYASEGRVEDEARLLYDPKAGRLPSTSTNFQASLNPGDATLWAVVHDSRGGVTWTAIPLHFR
jgi:hypothetical protein